MKATLIVLVAIAMLSLWWFWPQKVTLSPSEYDIAMALYRVCNQSSNEGLAQVEALLVADKAAHDAGDESPLAPIIATAKAGDWQTAAKACRRVLDDQIVR
ncbi:hypothetical protein [Allorhodopirellula heiligendammensis]|uniref:Uncharacterized protein n=1 Tax=Allorhodopirellula heiligendammensis TaxID=2714739 RepID=A0A5C6BUX8_9BACT|nr:hypothetical protein [Allorhodopirellula heiligendammensis]TWU15251.1 hypothetical protein Poly21_24450 [Allorhodopirellula heiligendammensis]